MSNPREISVIRFPKPMPYHDAYTEQNLRRNLIEEGKAGNALFLLEHERTFTMGRSSHEEHLLHSRDDLVEKGIEVCDVDRGGDVTYHGPGQLVAYPILDLQHWEKSVQWYLRTLEDVIIDTLSHYGLRGERIPKFTGVWVDGAKVAAIGIGIHQWVTYHGIAINRSPQMDDFKLIIPCGIQDKPVSSLSQLLENPPTMDELMDVFEEKFTANFSH
jgi:lipoyl(octanoyl) transferase